MLTHHLALRRLVRLWSPVLLYMGMIFVVSSRSEVPDLPPGVTDKIVHAILYAGLAALAVRALAGGRWAGVTLASAGAAVAIAVAYGCTDEVHQVFVPEREFDPADLVANAVGAAAAASTIWGWSIIRARKQAAGSGRHASAG